MTAPLTSRVMGQATVENKPPAPKRTRAPFRQLAAGRTATSAGKSVAGSEARRRAAMILEVLAGVQTPTSAAQALGIGVPRYYLVEQQALEGLLAACEPRPQGRTVNSDRQIARLERELATCRRELGRQQALARAAQRVLGLKTAAPTNTAGKAGTPGKGEPSRPGTGGKKSRKRKPVVRALRAARVLQAGMLKADSSISAVMAEVQIPTGDAPPAGGGNHSVGRDAGDFETQGAQGG